MNKHLAIIAFSLCCAGLFGQKLKIIQGTPDFLKDQKEINVEFLYDTMLLFKKNMTNEEYVQEHSAKLEEKTKGTGKSWEKSWYASRELIYAPKFLELMNRYLHENHSIYFGEEIESAPYTLVVETVWVYPGWGCRRYEATCKSLYPVAVC